EWRTEDFSYVLPDERIADAPVSPRDMARLLHVKRDALADCTVRDLPDLLRSDDLLVMNDTKVIPARLLGLRGEVKVEALLHKKFGAQTWSVIAKPGKRLKVGNTINFAPDFSAEVVEKFAGGEILIRFNVPDSEIFPLLHKYGHVPLPPYIKRPLGDTAADHERYQTVYAAREGAIAAPTAGLHFTPELFARLDGMGVERATVTLHVGAGTFLPVKVDKICDHVMHSEWGEISLETSQAINRARQAGRRIVAVGTTSLRLLETVADENGAVYPFVGETSIFIYPGYRFKAVDALMTNFHLPESTLFMLVSAFAGLERMKSAYAHAIDKEYRFYSYGDASLLERSE
ncbi:MAG: tRNA preQ1(34) S-adenosylmethionine ribosyltransferase-isomerase QueA, partial [Alphaproteobacteria bacterium]|nr:tRNA preQ1(34) S-adenosylmethionine ribosyltransferase-isomerase QueA [Alphaproteobacteria bacterium]